MEEDNPLVRIADSLEHLEDLLMSLVEFMIQG